MAIKADDFQSPINMVSKMMEKKKRKKITAHSKKKVKYYQSKDTKI